MTFVRRSILASLLATLGCSPEVVELVHFAQDASSGDAALELDAGSDGGAELDGTLPPGSCESSDDCPSDQFCEMPGCRARIGLCQRRTSDCSDETRPVCGCDGILYLNACLRRYHGVSEAEQGLECVPQSCSETEPCRAPAVCRLLVRDCRSSQRTGQCWVVPSECGIRAEGGNRYDECDGLAQCLSTCQAIQSGKRHVVADRCMPRSGIPFP